MTLLQFNKHIKGGGSVKYQNSQWRVVKMDIGGKCKIKKLHLPNKGRVISDVDFAELELLTNN
jgi:hypothetical protein